MPKKIEPKAGVKESFKTDEGMNKAKAAFAEYKKKMFAPYEAGAPAEMKPGGPFGSPTMYGPPSYPFPSPPFQNPMAGMHHPSGMPLPPFGPSPVLRGSLFENLGNLMRLGVDFLNCALAGGIQMVEGFSGTPHGDRDEPCGCHPDDDYHGYCSCHHGYRHCCCETECCCNPSVHGCSCC